MEPSRLLIFIVAYNAEKHIEKVLDRIPKEKLDKYDYEILIIDDQSKDSTFERALAYQKAHPELNLTVLYNPQNQGYGGNQKLGYHYAKIHNFEVVLLLHGDGQYAPEEFDRLVLPIVEGDADAVFGSRMLNKKDALKGKMPYYKFVGNIILTKMQNRILGTHLSEFHSGYRAYRVASLNRLPIERNSNDFHFDTQIIIQLVLGMMKIHEVPIPTHYGDEICYVNGIEYAYNIIKASIHSKFVKMGIFYKREYDMQPYEDTYTIKKEYASVHSLVLTLIPEHSKVLEISENKDLMSRMLSQKGCKVTCANPNTNKSNGNEFIFFKNNSDEKCFPEVDQFDSITLLDWIETSDSPELFLDELRQYCKLSSIPILVSSGNIGFFITRFQLLVGEFNYSKKGILDLKHKRLFTLKSLIKLCNQSGLTVEKIFSLPAPYPEALGISFLSRVLLSINKMLIYLSRGLFAYEYLLILKAIPTVQHLIKYSINETRKKESNLSLTL
jgi:glycosyltransferase involved in cell wall biosynthesis